jgi:hypothetical protein
MSIFQIIGENYSSFLTNHYKSNLLDTIEKKNSFDSFINKYFNDVKDNILIDTVLGNGYCIINAFLSYLRFTGIMDIDEINSSYDSIKEVIISFAKEEMLEKTGEEWCCDLNLENNIEIEPLILGILKYIERPIRISIIQYKDDIGERKKIIFNELSNDDHYIFLNKNGHFYSILLPKDIRKRIIIKN